MGLDESGLVGLKASYEAQRATELRKAEALAAWLHEVSGTGWRWLVKVLSGNDTLLTGAHQAGPYISRKHLFELFPTIASMQGDKATRALPTSIDSHGETRDLNAKWYPSKGEAHLTGWGGSKSPVLDPDATGSILVLAFHQSSGHDARLCRAWLCSSLDEEDEVQARIGPVEPGLMVLHDADGAGFDSMSLSVDSPCLLTETELPSDWRLAFPSASEIVTSSVERLGSAAQLAPDVRLVRRRECEFQLFKSLERAVVLPRIQGGFATVDLFIDFANSVTNRRKSRSGASLGLQTSMIFDEEELPHSYDKISEGNKRPDFIFPSAEAYQAGTPVESLAVLAAKTTCKDRWRQILNEADRVPEKHLLTLQQGVSLNQFDEMEKAGVVLVVPKSLHRAFHKKIAPKLLTLKEFIDRTRERCAT